MPRFAIAPDARSSVVDVVLFVVIVTASGIIIIYEYFLFPLGTRINLLEMFGPSRGEEKKRYDIRRANLFYFLTLEFSICFPSLRKASFY